MYRWVAPVREELKAAVLHVRPGADIMILWLVLALAIAVVSGFAAGTDYFAGDLWLTRKVQAIDVAPKS